MTFYHTDTIQVSLAPVNSRFKVLSVVAACFLCAAAFAQDDPYAEPEEPGLPPSNMELDLSRTAIVITDPQIDFLSLDGVT